jgi:hypothetical protein
LADGRGEGMRKRTSMPPPPHETADTFVLTIPVLLHPLTSVHFGLDLRLVLARRPGTRDATHWVLTDVGGIPLTDPQDSGEA